MKTAAIVVVLLALVIGIVPQFTDCQSQGKAITLPNGKVIAMKCHWTAQAALGLAAPILALGLLMAFSRRRESLRGLGIMGMLLGALTILLPTVLIGVCAGNEMLCNSVMQPTLILGGTLLAAASLMSLVFARRMPEQPV